MPNKSVVQFLEPKIIAMPPQKMAVAATQGDPNLVGEPAMKAIYGAVYKLKFDLKKQGVEFIVAPLRARWLDAHLLPKDQWTALWGLPVPEDTQSLVQKVPGVDVRLEVWEYGTVAQILHLGEYSAEGPTVKRLHDFIDASGYQIAGTHEEEYLTRPGVKDQKTLIRYPVRLKS
ncbi:MAG: GyrI-like domain-containing protein [Anaerolineaceae bacterium]|nr:GyrI-like domain-containing protein [Anaerolineaceae bacterium]